MTCAECRDAFSPYADDALSAEARGALETHLAGCADCHREWQRFFATVDLLRLVQPERAPAGFVDRVVAAARPLPWYRRLARGLLVPWPVKLPLQAAALVMVAGLAILVFQRSSDQAREMLRQEGLSSRPAPTDRAAGYAAPAGATAAPERKKQDAIAPTLADSRDAPAPAAKTEAGRLESAPPRIAQQQADEPVAARRQQTAGPAQQNALSARGTPPAAAPAAPPVPKSGAVATTAPAESFGEARLKRQDTLAKEVEKLTVRVPPSVELSLAVGDRAAAEPVVASIVERLGGAMVPGAAPAGFDIMVPRDAYSVLTGDLARLGTLRVLRQPAELPDSVRIGLQLTP